MIAENNEVLTSAAESLYQYNSDWVVRERCRAREDYERHQRNLQEKLAQKDEALKEKDKALKEKEIALKEKDAIIKSLEEKLSLQNN